MSSLPGDLVGACEEADDRADEMDRGIDVVEGAVRAAEAAGDGDAAELWSRRLLETAPESERDSFQKIRTLAVTQ